RIARGFGMKILAYDIVQDSKFAKEMGFEYVSLEKLLKDSDIISISVPGGKSTENLISKKEFARMKSGVVIINTARGNIIDTDALIIALEEGKVGAVGLDVLA